jgi:hypothetical protein
MKMPKRTGDESSSYSSTPRGWPDLLISFLSHGTVMPAEWMASQLAGTGAVTCAGTPLPIGATIATQVSIGDAAAATATACHMLSAAALSSLVSRHVPQ